MKCTDVELKTDSAPLLSVMSDMMLGVLDACVNADHTPIAKVWEAQKISATEREQTLKELLVFLNMLTVSSDVVFDVVSSPDWFNMLLKVVDIDEKSGEPYAS